MNTNEIKSYHYLFVVTIVILLVAASCIFFILGANTIQQRKDIIECEDLNSEVYICHPKQIVEKLT